MRRLRAVLAWLRTWGDMESTGRYAWGPDDPIPYGLADDGAGVDAVQDASDRYVDHVIARMEGQFAPAREEDPS